LFGHYKLLAFVLIKEMGKKNPALAGFFLWAILGSRRWRINFSPNEIELKIPLSQDFSCGQYWAPAAGG
jgi:hypothetical protein